MANEALTKIADQLEELVDQISDLHNNTTIQFSVDTYNLIASLWEEQHSIAKSLERIATALESK
jgi:hypothetical protein